MNVVVTGGAGFIGANLCRHLIADRAGRSRAQPAGPVSSQVCEVDKVDKVTALDDLSTGSARNLDGVDVELVEGSILDRDLLDDVTRDATAIVHLAARASVPRSVEDPMATHLVNATGTVEVLDAARRAGNVVHVIVASSSSVYGANPVLPRREDLATLPMSPYGASKLATESYALAYQHSYGLPVLAFRFFNVFGPLQSANHAYAAVVPAFMAAAVAGRPLRIEGDGLQSRDFTFVDTVTGLLADALARRVVSDLPVNLALGARTDILTLARMIEDIAGVPLTLEHVEPRAGDVRHSEGDPSPLRELFPGFEPGDLRGALEVTFDWFRANQDG